MKPGSLVKVLPSNLEKITMRNKIKLDTLQTRKPEALESLRDFRSRLTVRDNIPIHHYNHSPTHEHLFQPKVTQLDSVIRDSYYPLTTRKVKREESASLEFEAAVSPASK